MAGQFHACAAPMTPAMELGDTDWSARQLKNERLANNLVLVVFSLYLKTSKGEALTSTMARATCFIIYSDFLCMHTLELW